MANIHLYPGTEEGSNKGQYTEFANLKIEEVGTTT